MQSFVSEGYHGRRIRFKATVKMHASGPQGQAQLWLRVDRQAGRTAFFDNMHDRPITRNSWNDYEIVGEVPEDAVSINLGCMLIGNGRVCVRGLSFEVLGKLGEGNEPPQPLTGRGSRTSSR